MQRVIRYIDDEHLLVYWCGGVLQGDRCPANMGGLTVFSRHAHISHNALVDVVGVDVTCGFTIDNYEMVPQTGDTSKLCRVCVSVLCVS